MLRSIHRHDAVHATIWIFTRLKSISNLHPFTNPQNSCWSMLISHGFRFDMYMDMGAVRWDFKYSAIFLTFVSKYCTWNANKRCVGKHTWMHESNVPPARLRISLFCLSLSSMIHQHDQQPVLACLRPCLGKFQTLQSSTLVSAWHPYLLKDFAVK